jgi:hypothetical protein
MISGDARTYTFAWTSAHTVESARVRVQQPAGARDLSAQPSLAPTGAGADGLSYYEGDLGTLAPGDTVTLALSYDKTGSALTADAETATTGQPATAPPAANPYLPLVIGAGVLGVALIGGGLWAYRRGSRPAVRGRGGARANARRRAAAPRPRHGRAQHPAANGAARTAPRVPPAAGVGFCTQCGQRRQAEDRFCRQCGAPVPQP